MSTTTTDPTLSLLVQNFLEVVYIEYTLPDYEFTWSNPGVNVVYDKRKVTVDIILKV